MRLIGLQFDQTRTQYTTRLGSADERIDLEAADPIGQGGNPAPLPFLSLLGGASPVPSGAYSLTCEQGTYALTGQAAALRAARFGVAAQGTYALTGQANILRWGHVATAAQGSYSLTGQAAGLKAARTTTAAQGTYSLSGQAAGLLAARRSVADYGVYALSGQAATLTWVTPNRVMPADVGTYTLTGFAAGLTAPTAGQADEQPSGGWGALYFRWEQAQLAKRRKLAADEDSEQAPSADGTAESPSTPARNAAAPVSVELERLRELVATYGEQARAEIDHERVAQALARAVASPTTGAMLALDRAITQMREEEEMAVLLVAVIAD